MKPIIGVTPDFNAGDREDMGGREPTYFLRARYLRAIEELGGVPLILPLTGDRALQRHLLRDLDGLLLTGSGPDLPPSLYGERQRFRYRVMNHQRYEFELGMARLASNAGVPTLGMTFPRKSLPRCPIVRQGRPLGWRIRFRSPREACCAASWDKPGFA